MQMAFYICECRWQSILCECRWHSPVHLCIGSFFLSECSLLLLCHRNRLNHSFSLAWAAYIKVQSAPFTLFPTNALPKFQLPHCRKAHFTQARLMLKHVYTQYTHGSLDINGAHPQIQAVYNIGTAWSCKGQLKKYQDCIKNQNHHYFPSGESCPLCSRNILIFASIRSWRFGDEISK